MPKGKRAKPSSPEEYSKRLHEMKMKMRMKYSNPDRKDYKRTIAGRGDTHALDGGRIPFSKSAKGKAIREKHQNRIQPWQDRNVMNRGTKLNP
jgi:hypothetical protein